MPEVRQVPVPGPAAGLDQATAYEIRTEDGADHFAIMSRDEIAPADHRWHISVQGQGDVPIWRNLVAIGHRLRPGIFFCVGVPPSHLWMNVHPNVLHLWEMDDEHLTEQWRAEAQGHTPT
jgi:hypothetical protein